MVIWHQKCANVYYSLKMVDEWLFGTKNVQIRITVLRRQMNGYLAPKMCKYELRSSSGQLLVINSFPCARNNCLECKGFVSK